MNNIDGSQPQLRVLIIEDSANDAELILRQLRRGGYEVKHKRIDTRQALVEAIEHEQWDVIICDYSMPHFNGVEALQLIRAHKLDTPFIYVSGTLGEDTAIEALKHDAQDYLMKGELRRLVQAIERELREAAQRREKAQLEKHVQDLERFEAIGRLAGGIAHDFTNVISAIFGWAQLGAEEAPPGSTLQERFRRIESDAKRAADLTQKLLAFGRRQVLQPITLSLNRTIEEMRDFLTSGLGSSVELKMVLAPDLQAIQADPTQMAQVVMNLCLNARDAMPKGGRLVIETRNVQLDDSFQKLHSYGRPGAYVVLSVSDNGTGMDAATREKIFEPFFTTKEFGKGTGLGLSTVYGIVKQHDGFVNVYSEPGEGTTFRVYFPSSSGVPELRPPRTGGKPIRGTETILVVEDDDSLRRVAQEILAAQGYSVLVATNGQEAVRLFQEASDRIHLVLLDVIMPVLGGLEAHAAIKEIKPTAPVILTTGHTAEAVAVNPIAQAAVFLQKPYSPQSLSQIVRTTLDSQ